MKKIMEMILPAILLAGCCEEGPSQDLGTIKSVELKMGSFNSCDRTFIITDKAAVSICAAARVIPIGKPLTMSVDLCGNTVYRVVGTPVVMRGEKR